MELETPVKNHDGIITKIRGIQDITPEANKKILQEIADRFMFLLQQFAPTDTGEYKRSWQVLEIDELHCVVGIPDGMVHSSGIPMQDLFVVLEFGIDHEVTITAKNKKALHWAGDRFAKSVTLPPRPPRPHARTAYDDTNREIQDIINKIIREMYPGMK